MNILFYSDEKYEHLAIQLLESFRNTNNLDHAFIYYTLGFTSTLEFPNLIKKEWDLDETVPFFEFYKPEICIDALIDYDNILFLDVDIIISSRFAFETILNTKDYPLAVYAQHEFPFWQVSENSGVTAYQAENLMDYYGVAKRSMRYTTTCCMLMNKKCNGFLQEWNSMCKNKELITQYHPSAEFLIYYPFKDESAFNVCLWNRKATENLGHRMVNTYRFKTIKLLEENNNIKNTKLNGNLEYCHNSADVWLYHGTKDKIENTLINEYMKSNMTTQITSLYNITKPLLIESNLSFNTDISYSYTFGPKIEITSDDRKKFKVDFIDSATNLIHHSGDITTGMWTKANTKYFIDWNIKITHPSGAITNLELELSDEIVYIQFDSSSLGDTIAWMPYVEEFRKKHNCKVICKTFWNSLFLKVYPELKFIEPGIEPEDAYAAYKIGWFHDKHQNPIDVRIQALQKTASDILGLEYKEIHSPIKYTKTNIIPDQKYVCIAIQSTLQMKYWNYPGGWEEIADHLNGLGYKIVLVDKHKTFGIKDHMNSINKNLIDMTGSDYSFDDILTTIDNADLFVGLSSGLSWAAWALKTPVVMISGHTHQYFEFKSNVERIINEDVCHGCQTDTRYTFNKGDWLSCPTNKSFECTAKISPAVVKTAIDKIVKK